MNRIQSRNINRWRAFFKRAQTKFVFAAIAYLALVLVVKAHAGPPVLTMQAVGHDGFDVFADGVLVAPIRLAANGSIVADRIETNNSGLRFTALRAKDSQAVTFAADDYVSITLPDVSTNAAAPWEPVVQFKLTLRSFNTNKWLALFPGNPAPFHFLICSMPNAKVWHQRGWLNATPVADPFPLLQDVHDGSPEISCLWNRNWSYLCPLGGHPIPMIGLWDPAASLYVGYDFQGARVSDQSERSLATAYCWQQNANSNFVTLAYPYGGVRFGQQVFPKGGEVLSSWFHLEIDPALPDTEDPNERFQARLFERYTNSLPPVPAMNDLAWIPGYAQLTDFMPPPGLGLYGSGDVVTFRPPSSVVLRGWGGHREMPIAAAVAAGNLNAIVNARTQANDLLTRYAKTFTAEDESCLYWNKPLAGAWYPNWGGTNVTSLHNSEGWYAGRVLIELYRYDVQRGINDRDYLNAIDGIFHWAKHFVWSRNEFDDVPSSPFAIGSTLCTAFLLDYYFTFKNDLQRSTNAALALHLAGNITWRYLQCWAMDSDRSDGLVDSSFLAEPNSGRDWAALGCANEVNWNIDSLTQVYVHTGDPRMRYYLRGMLQRWPQLYRPIYETSIVQYGSDAFTEGYGVFDGAGPGHGNRYDYGFTEPLPINEPVGASAMRVVAGERACIAFNKGGVDKDVSDYRTRGDGNCSFRIISASRGNFDVSFSYPFVDISQRTVSRLRNGQTINLGASLLRRPKQSPSSLYFSQLQNGDVITIGTLPSGTPITPIESLLSYTDTNRVTITNGPFISIPLAGDYLLPQKWNDVHSFAGLIPGLRWAYGVPYQQNNVAVSNRVQLTHPSAYAVLVAYAPPADQTLTAVPQLFLNNGAALALSGHPVPIWRAWPLAFDRVILLDYALVPARQTVRQIYSRGTLVMGITAFTGTQITWAPLQKVLTAAAADFSQSELLRQRLLQLRNSFAQLPAGKIALLPLNTSGAAANFSAFTGLDSKWHALTETQLIDSNQFNPTLYPLAFYFGGENYVKTVSSDGDGKAAVAQYLAAGGTLVIFPTGPFPFYYGYGPKDQAGPADPLLPALGLPIYTAFEQPPTNLMVKVTTNQSILKSIPAMFAFPSGDQRLRAIDPNKIAAANRYIPWLSVSDASGKKYGDAAGFIEFGTGAARSGRIVYIWSTLLSSSQGQAIMADTLSWIIDATFRPSPSLISIGARNQSSMVIGFDASPNLDFTLQYRDDFDSGGWSVAKDYGSSPSERNLSFTNSFSDSSARYFRLWVRP